MSVTLYITSLGFAAGCIHCYITTEQMYMHLYSTYAHTYITNVIYAQINGIDTTRGFIESVLLMVELVDTLAIDVA